MVHIRTRICAGDPVPLKPATLLPSSPTNCRKLILKRLAGGHWPETLRVAAVTDVTEAKSASPSLGVLLRDIRAVFVRLDSVRLVTDQLIQKLKAIEESPWAVIRKGEPLDARWLARHLSRHGIEPKSRATARRCSRATPGPSSKMPGIATSNLLETLTSMRLHRLRRTQTRRPPGAHHTPAYHASPCGCLPPARRTPRTLPSSRRRNENNTCTATTRYAGCTECVLPEGHRGDHEVEEGVRWPDEDAIY